MNTPVSFELAKLLKEKGFDIPVFYYYENEKLVEPYLENGSSTDVEFRVDLSDLKECFNKWSSKRISAPTITDVIMWLYNKYGVWMWVEQFSTLFRPYAEEVGDERFGKWVGHKYNSPTEAYESGIEYILNNLI